ncbi:hypothetical protein [Afifella marina]|uniref:Uncharacterized protein n=1 Tax=Afifella marina DSM 2698 TaxID=1120955 RepID=A0A1G5MCG5_AFIMA|nr:hypothetical protein [Afifella marina]MBK1622634.1 hypothetical protein [Afifella marina DSM 2698]MBK1625629.1 hypothetical protein [Afifella marina]MBK5917452.1 hypothetical protein [Afifella marina]RAI23398.1 hypothetical protein CH311_00465 [Afifella marina DSM 2698]SCZ22843.1 hypothetical protein SAMN03080610_00460 [Afifella marina DSM 2698]
MAQENLAGIEAGNGKDKREDSFSLPQLDFEMALDMADGDTASWIDLVRHAAETSGGDLLFVLPSFSGDGEATEKAMVRLPDGESDVLIAVSHDDDGFHYEAEAAIDEELKDFAHASIDVLRRMQSDAQIVSPLVETEN